MKTAIEQVREALKAAHREAQESRQHFGSDIDRIHIASLVVQLSAALTSLKSLEGQEPQDETRVELVPNNYDCMLTCSKCGDGVPYYLLEEFDDISFCPNCGHRINKEKHGKKP